MKTIFTFILVNLFILTAAAQYNWVGTVRYDDNTISEYVTRAYLGGEHIMFLTISESVDSVNIKIYPVGIPGGGAWFIEIENNNKKNRTPNMFIKTQIWEKLFEYCKYYYDKYEK